ncbi:purine-cytosine permease family protein [Streptomyces sp. NBC_00009]|uniref:purine-cytosine permease family protein n=1 Tax=Streptomyces sp. NBC_00009 TaxID=2975620 RepID=UPI003254A458
MLWFSSNVQSSSLTSGMLATASFGLGWAQALVAIVLVSAVGAAAIGITSTCGPPKGVGLLVQTRLPLGRRGAAVPAVLVFLKACAWFAVNSILGAFAVQTLVGTGFGPAFALVTVAQVAIALVGYGFIHLVQKVMALVLPLLFIGVSLYGYTESNLGSGFDPGKAGPLGFVGAFALVVAIQAARALSFSSYAADYTRYMPVDTPPRKLFLFAFTGWRRSTCGTTNRPGSSGAQLDLCPRMSCRSAAPTCIPVISDWSSRDSSPTVSRASSPGRIWMRGGTRHRTRPGKRSSPSPSGSPASEPPHTDRCRPSAQTRRRWPDEGGGNGRERRKPSALRS